MVYFTPPKFIHYAVFTQPINRKFTGKQQNQLSAVYNWHCNNVCTALRRAITTYIRILCMHEPLG